MKRLTIGLMLVLTSFAVARAQGLKDAYEDYFTIGVAVNPTNVSTPEQMALIVQEFNSITAENVMKPGEIHPAEGVWNFEEADRVANFCRENNIKYGIYYVYDMRNGGDWDSQAFDPALWTKNDDGLPVLRIFG